MTDPPASWAQELRLIAAEAAGDLGVLVALIALRRVENGAIGDETHPSRAFGVLSVPAPTYEDQLRIAAISLRNEERRLSRTVVVRTADGFLTPHFFTVFSARWAPIGADNDPHGVNANHARNLMQLSNDYAGALRASIARLG